MKQVVQSPRTGKLELLDVPAPALVPGQILVRTHYSIVSPGTEKMALEFARKSMLGKARSRPDLVQQVVRKLRQEGPAPTYRAVMTRLDAPQPLGYSSAGVVEAVGDGVAGFAPGDRVACAGAGYANHAELVSVPENLAALVPDGVALEDAAFATVGAIALQGLRVADPTLGEVVAVIGLGLIGQLTVQLLRANGCRVLGIDLHEQRVKQAADQGAEWTARPGDEHRPWILGATGGYGADAVIVTAASDSSAPLTLAAELCRARGRVVAVGATAMDLDRRTFYEKELELRMSMSYGPGRYDRRYEELGLDYPITQVRWTENRNLRAFLALAASGGVAPRKLDTETIPFAEAPTAYESLAAGERRHLAAIFRYVPERAEAFRHLSLTRDAAPREGVGIAFLGAGSYAKSVLLPAVGQVRGARKVAIVTATGASARRSAEKFGYAACATDPEQVLGNPEVDLVFVTTQHDSHARLAASALRAGKAVWLEKPAALDEDQLSELAQAAADTGGFLAIGYNRRFSSHAQRIHEHCSGRGPLAIHYTVAAGPTPTGTWLTDPSVGGGRIVGEVCHFVDLLLYLTGSRPISVFARALSREPELDDSTVAEIGFADGSTATLHYLARTAEGLPKERFEVSGGGRTAQCDNFRETRLIGGRTQRTVNQDKGQTTAVAEVIDAVRRGKHSPFTLEEILDVSRTTFAIVRACSANEAILLERTTRELGIPSS